MLCDDVVNVCVCARSVCAVRYCTITIATITRRPKIMRLMNCRFVMMIIIIVIIAVVVGTAAAAADGVCVDGRTVSFQQR